MEVLEPARLEQRLKQFGQQTVYIHFEGGRGAYWRNARATVVDAHVRGDGPYRVFLVLDNSAGLLQIDDISHMRLEDDVVICSGYDSSNRLRHVLEISTAPFSMEWGE